MDKYLVVKFYIIIPIYNVERYLKKCLDSVLHQTYNNFDVILINDGSSDKSYDIAKKYVQDKRFTLISQTNQGISQARNKGLDVAKERINHKNGGGGKLYILCRF